MPAEAWWEHATPVGPLLLTAQGEALCGIHFQAGPTPRDPPLGALHMRLPFGDAIAQLDEYFAGTRRDFDLPLHVEGTPFQRAAWAAMQAIPYGETAGYGELARRMGKAGAVRAVGQACGANPLPIVIPCHRVLASGHAAGGFGGGLAIKRQLLELESRGMPFALDVPGRA